MCTESHCQGLVPTDCLLEELSRAHPFPELKTAAHSGSEQNIHGQSTEMQVSAATSEEPGPNSHTFLRKSYNLVRRDITYT